MQSGSFLYCFFFLQETTETAPSEDQADYEETFSFSDSETVASSHDDRAGAENSASDDENGEKGISSNPKGFFHILSCQFVDGLTREPHH